MKIGRYICILIILLLIGYNLNKINISDDVVVNKGDGYSVFYNHMSIFDKWMLKLYLKLNYQRIPTLYPGLFRFEEWLSYKKFLETIAIAPKSVAMDVRLLEWWSSYDYDDLLTKKGLISSWSYRLYITNPDVISQLQSRFAFLPKELNSLEWFLYPDTYKLDSNRWNAVEQLVSMQLDNFYNKVRWPDPSLFTGFSQKLQSDWFVFKMSAYSIIKLASIIENEEKNDSNKQTIAWLFLNRIAQGILLGADVTVCYGYGITYDRCTPKFIWERIYDKWNVYNTRTNPGLPPTPISNPSIKTIAAVLVYTKTPYIYYLHDNQWWIHYGTTLEEHNSNKAKYIY